MTWQNRQDIILEIREAEARLKFLRGALKSWDNSYPRKPPEGPPERRVYFDKSVGEILEELLPKLGGEAHEDELFRLMEEGGAFYYDAYPRRNFDAAITVNCKSKLIHRKEGGPIIAFGPAPPEKKARR